MGRRGLVGRWLGVLVLLGVLALEPAAAVRASTTFTVNSLSDSPSLFCPTHCTLRDAITQANFYGGGASIGFSVTGTITLTSSLPTLDFDMTIIGPGATLLTVSGNNNSAVSTIFALNMVTVAISGLTVSGGSATNGGG